MCEGGPEKPKIGRARMFDSFKLLNKAGGDVSAWVPLLDMQLLKEYHEEVASKKKKGAADVIISQSAQKEEGENCALVRELIEWNAKSLEEKAEIMVKWVEKELQEIEYEWEKPFSEEEREKWLAWEPKWVSAENSRIDFAIRECRFANFS